MTECTEYFVLVNAPGALAGILDYSNHLKLSEGGAIMGESKLINTIIIFV